MKNDPIGDRMKTYYENRFRYYLPRRIPVIIRLDGQTFTKYTKQFDKPFCQDLKNAFVFSTLSLMENVIQGSKCAYLQSDEVSILVTDFDRLETDAWFNYNVQKIASISSSRFTGFFNYYMYSRKMLELETIAAFDSRCFSIPEMDVANYFYWRQLDWERNSLQMLTRHYYSHAQMRNKKKPDMHEMLHKVGVNWADLNDTWKNGTFIRKVFKKESQRFKYEVSEFCPNFKNDRSIFIDIMHPNS